jgi:hypothetical protein
MIICECGKRLKLKNFKHLISNMHLMHLQKNILEHINKDNIEYEEIEIKM